MPPVGDDLELPRQDRRVCGESFIRSYAILTKSTDQGDAILSWYGSDQGRLGEAV